MEIKLFQQKKKFKKGGLHTNPDLFWNILQILALLIVLTSFFFGFFLFQKINNGLVVMPEEVNSGNKMISKGRIDEALGYFKKKSNVSQEIISSPSPIVDPSR